MSAGERGPQLRPVGRRALLLEVADVAAARRWYDAIRAAVDAGELDPPRDLVPAARTVLADGVDVEAWRARLPTLRVGGSADTGPGREVRVPVVYDGPDLEDVARAWGCSPDEVPVRHAATAYVVAFSGFAPGFAYCVGDHPPVPRRADPRTRVPAGSVGLAGRYCGVYPAAMPGGWRLIGTTAAAMFDPGRPDPALLRPGDRVVFEAAP